MGKGAADSLYHEIISLVQTTVEAVKLKEIAQSAWTQQKDKYRKEAKRNPVQARKVVRVNTSFAPAWFAEEARRHTSSAADPVSCHYERACLPRIDEWE